MRHDEVPDRAAPVPARRARPHPPAPGFRVPAAAPREAEGPPHLRPDREAVPPNSTQEANRRQGVTGENMLRFLELRLDNVVFRAGWGSSRAQARQFVRHGHVAVNGKRVTIPSYRVRKGDVVTLRDKARSMIVVRQNLDTLDRQTPPWLETGDGGLPGHRARSARFGSRSTCRCASSSSSSSTPSSRPLLPRGKHIPCWSSSDRRSKPSASRSANRQRFADQPARARLRPHARQLAAAHAAVVDPGAAVTQVRFDDALHEFDTIKGVTEDVTDIILNLKDLVLQVYTEEPVTLRLDAKASARTDVTAADIQPNADVEILNPDLHIATLNDRRPARHRHHGRKGRGLRVGRAQQGVGDDRCDPGRLDLLAGAARRVRGRAHPCRAGHRTTTASCSTSRPTGRSRPASRWPRPAPRCRRSCSSSREMSEEPQGLELGEVATPLPARPTSSCPSRTSTSPSAPATASSGRRSTRSASCSEDRGRPAGHHQLRPEVARRGHQKLDERGLSAARSRT